MIADTDQPTLAVLKPCPFCGSTTPQWVGSGDGNYVECGSCLATMPPHDPDVPNETDRWNTRTTHEPRPAGDLREALGQLLREQGVQANGHVLTTCGSTTGHIVAPLAFCKDADTAAILAAALATHSPAPMAGAVQIVRDYQTVADAKYLSVKSRIDGGEEGLELTLAVALGLSHQAREIHSRLIAAHPSTQEGDE